MINNSNYPVTIIVTNKVTRVTIIIVLINLRLFV